MTASWQAHAGSIPGSYQAHAGAYDRPMPSPRQTRHLQVTLVHQPEGFYILGAGGEGSTYVPYRTYLWAWLVE